MKSSVVLLTLVVVLVAFELATAMTMAKRCGKRPKVKMGWSLYPPKKYRGRPKVTIAKTCTVTANNGVRRTLAARSNFFGCGCVADSCVVYGDRPDFLGTKQQNDDGTTFFANINRKCLKFRNTAAAKKIRGSFPLKKVKKVVSRKVITTNIRNEDIFHGPGAPMWEYTWLGNGMFVTGAVTPASYYVGTKKIGLGYNTGLFKPGQTFYDACAPVITTRVRHWSTAVAGPWEGPGFVEWVFGYIKVSAKAKVWCWMIQKISIDGRNLGGNIA